jgi:hypothetical protein
MGTPQNPAVSLKPAIDSAVEGISRASILRLLSVAAAGSIGGFLFWVLAKLAGTAEPGLWTIPALMLVGAFAAAIGVYVLTASDTSAIKTYIFASLCGLCWQPVINSGINMVKSSTDTAAQVSQLENQQQSFSDALQQATPENPQPLNSVVKQTTNLINQAVVASAKAGSGSDNQQSLIAASNKCISQIQNAAAKAPDSSVEALQNITVTAANSGTQAVALQAIQSLHAISRAQNPASEKARQSLTYIASQAKDPAIQSAAKVSPQPKS